MRRSPTRCRAGSISTRRLMDRFREVSAVGGFALLSSLVLGACSPDQTAEESTPTEEPAPSAEPTPTVSVEYLWLALGPGGQAVARAVTAAGASCPSIELDTGTHAMQPRGPSAPPGFSEIQVCEYFVPAGTRSASIAGQALALPAASPDTIVVVGDTGCRVKGTDVQNCNGQGTGPAWQFPRVAGAIESVRPDLILHVGDYHYREEGDCAGGCDPATLGYTWKAWEADFFAPARSLLPKAPWVFVRGNHEDCGDATTGDPPRAWKGWFYLLDPHPLTNTGWTLEDCGSYTDPYLVPAGAQSLLIMDTSEIPDDYARTPDSTTVARYAHEFSLMEGLADGSQNPIWLATHRPFWAVASWAPDNLGPADATLQAALAQSDEHGIPASVKMLIAGHVHLFELLTFPGMDRPPQLIFGGGATQLDPEIDPADPRLGPILQGLGSGPGDFTSIHDIDFGVIVPGQGGWTVTIKRADGTDAASFTVSG